MKTRRVVVFVAVVFVLLCVSVSAEPPIFISLVFGQRSEPQCETAGFTAAVYTDEECSLHPREGYNFGGDCRIPSAISYWRWPEYWQYVDAVCVVSNDVDWPSTGGPTGPRRALGPSFTCKIPCPEGWHGGESPETVVCVEAPVAPIGWATIVCDTAPCGVSGERLYGYCRPDAMFMQGGPRQVTGSPSAN